MKVKVAKWGNSLGVRLPKAAIDAAGVALGTDLDLTVENGEFRLRTTPKITRYRLSDLLDQISPDNVPELIDFGPAVGAEIIEDDYSR